METTYNDLEPEDLNTDENNGEEGLPQLPDDNDIGMDDEDDLHEIRVNDDLREPGADDFDGVTPEEEKNIDEAG